MRIITLLAFFLSAFCLSTLTAFAQGDVDPAPAATQQQEPTTQEAESETSEAEMQEAESETSEAEPPTQDPQAEKQDPQAEMQDPQAETQEPAQDAPQGSDTRSESDSQAQQDEESRTTGPKYQAYIKAITDGRALTAEIDRLFSSIPVGFPKLQQQHRQRIATLKAQQVALTGQLIDLAIEAFREAPKADRNVARIVFSQIVASMNPRKEGQKFAPAKASELAELMISSGFENKDLYFLAFRAAFARQEFEQAESMLNKIVESGSKLPPQVWDRFNIAKENWKRELELREKEAAADDLPRVQFETTAGNFVVELFEDQAPQTVANFISLVEKGFYDGLIFHLVKPGTLIQSGCPQGNGKGDPGYRISCECYQDEIRHHFIGTISMANDGRDKGGSQFFITHQPNPPLDGKYTVFGRVIENTDVIYDVNTIDRTTVIPTGSLEPTIINRISVVRKRDHVYEPTIAETDAAEPESNDLDLLSQPEGGSGGGTKPPNTP